MQKLKLFFLLCLTIAMMLPVQAQRKSRKKVKYQPVTAISRDDAWPLVAQAIASLGLQAEYFSYGEGVLRTSHYSYKKGLIPNRGKIVFRWADETLHLEMTDLELKETNSGNWVPTYPDPLFPKEKQIKGEVAQAIRLLHQDAEALDKAKQGFANNLLFHASFFNTASELAGDIWFGKFLKDRQVRWTAKLGDVQKSSTEGYQYEETLTLGESSLQIKVLTNSDAHVFSNKGSNVQVQATCSALVYKDGNWEITLLQ